MTSNNDNINAVSSSSDVNVTVVNSDPFTQLEMLYKEQQVWNDTLYTTCTSKLYSMLAGCLDVCAQYKGERKRRALLDNWLTAAGLKFNDGTALETKIVRYVFRITNKRSLTYARVLRIAIAEGIKSDGFVAWVIEQGGLEEVRRKFADGVSPAVRKKQVVKAAADILLEANTIVALNELPQQLEVNTDGTLEFSLALVRKNKSTGFAEIVRGTKNASVIAKFLAVVGKEVIDARTAQLAIEQQATAAEAAEKAIDAAMAALQAELEDLARNDSNALAVAA